MQIFGTVDVVIPFDAEVDVPLSPAFVPPLVIDQLFVRETPLHLYSSNGATVSLMRTAVCRFQIGADADDLSAAVPYEHHGVLKLGNAQSHVVRMLGDVRGSVALVRGYDPITVTFVGIIDLASANLTTPPAQLPRFDPNELRKRIGIRARLSTAFDDTTSLYSLVLRRNVGCTDAKAQNFVQSAELDDESCTLLRWSPFYYYKALGAASINDEQPNTVPLCSSSTTLDVDVYVIDRHTARGVLLGLKTDAAAGAALRVTVRSPSGTTVVALSDSVAATANCATGALIHR